ncbi:HNH endonuclease [Microbacterium sp. SGAir0570]|uniref:HNH endonuclease signature motif containing protein n=1 Tax=Microbacterium sp. SGAir0570 TaxID=2070348 RepID=UPI0010CD1A40|nr:HNH endonuclease signature motif containing protein [Microbacterium sp. SGAir0570]QCR39394.1 HNH endonuclease [Microbacterium sp. SGAir0570]
MTANGAGGEVGRGTLAPSQALAFSRYAEALDLSHAADLARTRALADLGRAALHEARRDGVRGMASDMELRSVAAEAAGMARLTDRRLQGEIDHAMTVIDDYPAVFEAWVSRRIERGHVDVVVRVGAGVPVEVRSEYAEAAIGVCERDVPSRVRGALEALAARLHPQTFTERHKTAVAERCVRVFHGSDGMSNLVASLPTVIAAGMLDRLTQMGQSVKDARVESAGADGGADAGADAAGEDAAGMAGAGMGAVSSGEDAAGAGAAGEAAADTRTMDQLRADILGDLVLGGAPVVDPTYGTDRPGGLGAIRARVQVAVTAETLMGRDENPAEAVGGALIDADTARQLAGQVSEWDRLFIDPVTRTPVEIHTYRPTASMKKLLMARDQHCRFPGCRRAAIRCEIDHTVDHALGGHTHISNLAHLCQRHHSMKQFIKWEVRQLGGGVLEWTSPLGRVYREDVPIPAVCFTSDTANPPPDEPPPF